MLQAHLSSKVATLVEEVYRRAGYGVLKNTSFTVETVLVLVYKLLSNTDIPQQQRYVTVAPSVVAKLFYLPQTQTRSHGGF